MSDPLLRTKLYIPPIRRAIVPRPGLIARLNEGLAAGSKLTLISAPAGFGKTTLVSEWIANCGRPVGWLSLDEGDTNPARFLSYLVTALQLIKPDIGEGLIAVLQSREPPRLEAVLTDLINEITSIPDNFIVVLDDYHSVESKPVDQAINFLIEHQPPQMHLLIASREDPPLPLARLRARGQLTELRATDLRFSPTEAADFLNHVMDLSLSSEDIAALENRTEGWIAGLQMAALSMRGLLETGDFIRSFTGSHRFVLDYLMEEVLELQTEEVQTFLLHTSILDRLCGPLCDALLIGSSASGQQTLEHLEHVNLFIVPLDSDRRWYRYHHLFGDLLFKRLEQKLSVEKIAELHIQASEWYENNGLILDAFKQAATANDIERAERLMENKEMPVHLPGVPVTILKWLGSLPVSVLNAKPALWWKQAAMMLSNYQTIGVEEKLQAAEAALALKIPPNTEMDEWSRNLVGKIAVARAMLAATLYQAETSLLYANRALEYLHPNNVAYRSNAIQFSGFAHYLLGDRDAAEEAYTEALSLAQAAGDNEGVLLAYTRLGQVHVLRNELHQAAEKFQRALQLTGEDPIPFATVVYGGLARIYYEWNDLDTAEKYGELSYRLGLLNEQIIDRSILSQLLMFQIRLTRGDLVGAAIFLAQAEQNTRQKDFAVRLPDIAAGQAMVHLYQGNIDAAVQIAMQNDLPLLQARTLIAHGDPSDALALIEPYRQKMEEKGWKDELLRVLALKALAHHLQGEKDPAVQGLSEALALAEPGGFIRLFVDEGEPMRLLIVDFRMWIEKQSGDRSHALTNYVQKILTAFAPSEAVSGSAINNPQSELIDPLSLRELEVVKLLRSDLSGPEIALQLSISINTFRTHTKNIFIKLGVNDRRAAIRRAEELNII